MSGGGKKGGKEGQEFKFDFGTKAAAEGQSSEAPKFDFGGSGATLVPAFLQQKMKSLLGKSSGYFETLPAPVQGRIRALKKLHKQKQEIDSEYKKELLALEEKYTQKKKPLFDRRSSIISGQEEPTAEEAQPDPDEAPKGARLVEIKDEGEVKQEVQEEGEKKEGAEEAKEEAKEDVKGIPEFWLQTLMHHDDFAELITKKDEEALKYLKNIVTKTIEGEPSSFAIDFFFEKNPFFENEVLTKTYHLEDDEMRGETMFKESEGTEIQWKPKKNLTVKLVTSQQNKGRGGRRGGRGGRGGKGAAQGKTVTVEKPTESFFNFFSSDALFGVDEDEMEPEDMEAMLEADYELGVILKEQVLPNAVLWFTGEMISDDMGGAYDDDGESGEYDSEEDADFVPDANAPQPECKQQ